MFTCYIGVFTEMHVYTLIGYFVSELHAHLCPYRSVWPEAVHRNVTFLFHGRYGYVSVRKVSFLNSVWLLRYASRN